MVSRSHRRLDYDRDPFKYPLVDPMVEAVIDIHEGTEWMD